MNSVIMCRMPVCRLLRVPALPARALLVSLLAGGLLVATLRRRRAGEPSSTRRSAKDSTTPYSISSRFVFS